MRQNEDIASRLLVVRGVRVMIDADPAALYEVETRLLNQAVRRNPRRFPPDPAFRISSTERTEVVTKCDHLRKLKSQIMEALRQLTRQSEPPKRRRIGFDQN